MFAPPRPYPWQTQQPIPSQDGGGIGPSNPEQMIQEQYQAPSREDWRDQWMSRGQMSPQDADNWLRTHGAQQQQGGEKAGRWVTPHGEALDLQIGRGGAMATGGKITPGWTSQGESPNPVQQSPMGPSWGNSQWGQQQGGGVGQWMQNRGMQPQVIRQGAQPMQKRMGGMGPYGNSGVNPYNRPNTMQRTMQQAKTMQQPMQNRGMNTTMQQQSPMMKQQQPQQQRMY